MFNAYTEGRMKDILVFDEAKPDLLREAGFPQEDIWLTDLDTHPSDSNTGILFYHENGTTHQHVFFDMKSMDSFKEACNILTHRMVGDPA